MTVQPPLSDVGTPQNPNLTLPNGSIGNTKLADSLTVTAGAGLSGGGAVALGGSVAVAMPNVGPNATIPYPCEHHVRRAGASYMAATAGNAPPAAVLSVTVQPRFSDVGTVQNPNPTLPNGSIGNAKLANSSLTVTAGAGLSGAVR